MSEQDERGYIFEKIREHLVNLAKWDEIEAQVSILCSDIPDAKEDRIPKVIEKIRDIKDYLLDNDISGDVVSFLDEEMERYKYTKQISLYNEEDDQIDPETVAKYSNLSGTAEGIVGIHLPLNYEQVKKLTNGVYKQTNNIKFYVSREKRMAGQIISEIYETPQTIPVATKCLSKNINEEETAYINLFGSPLNTKKWIKVKEIKCPFWVYRFIDEKEREYIILSHERQEVGECIVTGMSTEVDDLKQVTESVKLPTKLPYFFSQDIKPRVTKFKSHDEFFNHVKSLSFQKKSLFNYPFAVFVKKDEIRYVLKHPEWFMWLIWSWLVHKSKGMATEYPFHLFIAGPKGSGKSYLLNTIHAISREQQSIFSGRGSTIKKLVPSFKYNPPDIGFLAKSNRFAFCDEFLGCIIKTTTGGPGDGSRTEALGVMNDMLEHQKRAVGSGVSSVNVNMRARTLAVTNPIRGMQNVEDMLEKIDESFMSRWLIYWQHEDGDHVQKIRNTRKSDLSPYSNNMHTSDWVSIIDYLQSFHADYNYERMDEIYESQLDLMTEKMKMHYQARHKHHIECLLDGIIKTRCLLDRDDTFSATERDYVMLDVVWSKVIGSWIDGENVKGMPVHKRIKYLPEKCQFIYDIVKDHGKPLSRFELEEKAMKGLSKSEFRTAYIILRDNSLVYERDGFIKTFFMVGENDK